MNLPGRIALLLEAARRPPLRDGPRAWLTVVVAMLLAAGLCLLLVFYLSLPLPWWGGQAPRTWAAEEFRVVRGAGGMGGAFLAIREPDSTGVAIAAMTPAPFRASDFREVSWKLEGVGEGVSVALLWRSDYAPATPQALELKPRGRGEWTAWVAEDRRWIGKIVGLALLVKGELAQPLRLVSLTLSPRTVPEILSERVGAWFAFAPWQKWSVNSLESQSLPWPPTVAAALLAGTAIGLYLAAAWIFRWRRDFGVLLGIALACWMLLDLRWQANLLRQTFDTAPTLAPDSVPGLALASEEAPIRAFADAVRKALPAEPARVILAAEEPYARARLAYHLLPHRSHFRVERRDLPAPGELRSGDFIAVLARRSMQFSPNEGLLRWDDQDPVAAELIFANKGNALFRIR